MPDIGLLGALGTGAGNFADSYVQAKREKRAQDLQNQQLKLAQLGEAAKLIDLTGDLPKGLLSPDIESVFKPGDIGPQQNQGLIPNQLEQPSNPKSGGLLPQQELQPQQQVAPTLKGPAQSGSLKMPGVPGAVQGGVPQISNPGYLTRPLETPYKPKHVKEGEKAAFEASSHAPPGIQYQYDPDKRSFIKVAVPYSAKDQLELQKTTQQVKNETLEPQFKIAQEYKQEPVVKDFGVAYPNWLKMIHTYENKNLKDDPTAQKGLVYNFIRLENPGAVAREGSLEDVRENLPQIYARYKNAIDQAVSGSMSPEQIQSLMRGGANAYLGFREAHKGIQDQYRSQASTYGLNPAFVENRSYDALDKKTSHMLDKLGAYQPVKAGSMLGDLFKSVIGKPTGSAMAAPPKDVKSMTREEKIKFLRGD